MRYFSVTHPHPKKKKKRNKLIQISNHIRNIYYKRIINRVLTNNKLKTSEQRPDIISFFEKEK